MAMTFAGTFRGCRVLVTGDTGFKGAWLCHWLVRLGADVTGLALPPDTQPNLFDDINLRRVMRHRDVDVRDAAAVREIVKNAAPEFVFHLAAQPLVRRSYREPVETFAVNVMGTVNILDAALRCATTRGILVVTTDKVYENKGESRAFQETDRLGGHDPYSASKAAAEFAVASYRHALFPSGPPIVVARAGNVIGGGDWAEDRLVPDIMRALSTERPVELRHPRAVRPWQHVLDALSGYLLLLARVSEGPIGADAFNFGPDEDEAVDVGALAHRLCAAIGRGSVIEKPDSAGLREASSLMLDSSLARTLLGWQPVWDTQEAIARTATWYRAYLDEGARAASDLLDKQLVDYVSAANERGFDWVGAT
jgi:CDP-glucose 4,6-dehydratase